ncbi:MAG: hypothetical protein K0R18_2156, partial [Bacillales bacterium]|nr:hypothetical protein [Bacillales bacterium]
NSIDKKCINVYIVFDNQTENNECLMKFDWF